MHRETSEKGKEKCGAISDYRQMSMLSVSFRHVTSNAKILVVKKLLAISKAHQLNQMCVLDVLKVKLRSSR